MPWPRLMRKTFQIEQSFRLPKTWRLCVFMLLAACAQPSLTPSATLPPLTRVVSVATATTTPPPPSATPTATATSTPTVTVTPVPPTPTPTVPAVVQFMAVGDLMLARTVGARTLENGAAWPFAGVADVLAQADILVGNLECVI